MFDINWGINSFWKFILIFSRILCLIRIGDGSSAAIKGLRRDVQFQVRYLEINYFTNMTEIKFLFAI